MPLIITKNHKLLWIIFSISLIVVFETSQQYYYITQFNLVDTKTLNFWLVLQGQLYRWLFWLAYGVLLWKYVQIYPISSENLNHKTVLQYTGIVSILLVVNIISISAFQLLISSVDFTGANFLENFIFYTFQKCPIYLIAYTALILLAHYWRHSNTLIIQSKELQRLKENNAELFSNLNSISDKKSAIQVKTGNRIKLVSIDDIRWIEANDYCVTIHDNNDRTHTLRTSLKALENQLPSAQFVRTHRKAIVNLHCVAEWKLTQDPQALLDNGVLVPVAQSRVPSIRMAFESVLSLQNI